ncbi:MAG TPA: 23S rRNA (pseudouridine(1915)-N(3))-methyltransferase RlmH [Steroidobacteraceae bacterium]
MRLRVIAVGTRTPRWVREVFEEYASRLPSTLKLSVTEIEPGPRSASRSPQQAIEAESQRILAALRKDEFAVALDEHADQLTTRELANWLGTRMQEGRDVAFIIGGPDGLSREVLSRAQFKLSLSRLTLPHMLVRIIIAEQLYRAYSVLTNHPYHRE